MKEIDFDALKQKITNYFKIREIQMNRTMIYINKLNNQNKRFDYVKANRISNQMKCNNIKEHQATLHLNQLGLSNLVIAVIDQLEFLMMKFLN